jgi:hypothetical protein
MRKCGHGLTELSKRTVPNFRTVNEGRNRVGIRFSYRPASAGIFKIVYGG